jgi:hypothetical protein
MGLLRVDQLTSGTPAITDWILSTPTGGPSIKATWTTLYADTLLNQDNTWTGTQQFNDGIVTQGEAATNISNVALTSNVVTITSTAHGLAVGQAVTVAAVTNTAVNGTFVIASVPTANTFTYALVHANIASGADTGTVQGCQQTVLNSSGVLESYVTAGGQLVWLTSSGQPLVIANATTPADTLTIYHDGTNPHFVSSTGSAIKTNSLFAGNSPWTIADNFGNIVFSVTGGAPVLFSHAGMQDTPYTARITTPVTNATAAPVNLTDLTTTLIAGRKYLFRLVLFANNSVGAEGLQILLNGGTATVTSIEFGFPCTPVGATLGTSNATALATALTATVVATGDQCYVVEGELVCNAGGTFIPAFAEVSHSLGTATVSNGSLRLFDSPT